MSSDGGKLPFGPQKSQLNVRQEQPGQAEPCALCTPVSRLPSTSKSTVSKTDPSAERTSTDQRPVSLVRICRRDQVRQRGLFPTLSSTTPFSTPSCFHTICMVDGSPRFRTFTQTKTRSRPKDWPAPTGIRRVTAVADADANTASPSRDTTGSAEDGGGGSEPTDGVAATTGLAATASKRCPRRTGAGRAAATSGPSLSLTLRGKRGAQIRRAGTLGSVTVRETARRSTAEMAAGVV